ncbi:MAG: 3'-5' exonuclease [Desulfobulbus propionicus]|nr:MAG: 3'-5' exonuclease [Desulfobulbus propionicus]
MHSPQTHQIPGKSLRNLLVRLKKEEINALPLARWEGPIHIVSNQTQLQAAVKTLRTTNLLGFDTETRPTFRKGQSYPPALLQLADGQSVFLFKLYQLGIPKALTDILSNQQTIKVGVAVGFDTVQLQQIHPFLPQGFIDLADISRHLGMQHHGLRGLAAVTLGIRISKSVRTTNWAAPDLSAKQIRYAATDAWISRAVYSRLMEIHHGDIADDTPPFSHDS